MKKVLKVMGIILIVLIVAFAGYKFKKNLDIKNEKKEMAAQTYKWPDSDIANLLPKPTSSHGNIHTEGKDTFYIDIYGSKKEYNAYVKKCKDKGFTNHETSIKNSYFAQNQDGYNLTVNYWKETETCPALYTIIISVPEEETTATVDTTEFKKTIDSYEKFFDKYIKFMKKYDASNDPSSMANDYANYMSQYADTMSKLDGVNQADLSEEDLNYYMQVHARIMQKLAQIQ